MALFERKCRECGKWARMESRVEDLDEGKCPFCHKPYGGLAMGLDVFLKGEKSELVDPKTAGRADMKGIAPAKDESKVPAPKPGEYGYVPPSPKRGAGA